MLMIPLSGVSFAQVENPAAQGTTAIAATHAFPNGQRGNVEVSLHRCGGMDELTVADDGAGLSKDFDFQRAKTLGLQLVRSLTAKLGGEIKIDGSGGTRIQINIPEELS